MVVINSIYGSGVMPKCISPVTWFSGPLCFEFRQQLPCLENSDLNVSTVSSWIVLSLAISIEGYRRHR